MQHEQLSVTSRTPIGFGFAAAVVIGLLASIVGLIGVAVGLNSSVSATSGTSGPLLAAAALRTVLSIAVVFAGVFLATLLSGRGSAAGWAGFAALGVVFDVWAWGGNALFAATLLSGGALEQGLLVRVVGFVVDLGVWVVVAWVAARFGLAAGVRRREGANTLR